MDKTFVAWAAGFFDGKGCVQITRSQPRGTKSPTHTLVVTVSQNDYRPLHRLRDAFGGSVNKVGARGNAWQITGQKALRFLQMVQLYLQVKQEQAHLAAEFMRSRIRYSRGHRLPRKEVELRDAFRNRMADARHMYQLPSGLSVSEKGVILEIERQLR